MIQTFQSKCWQLSFSVSPLFLLCAGTCKASFPDENKLHHFQLAVSPGKRNLILQLVKYDQKYRYLIFQFNLHTWKFELINCGKLPHTLMLYTRDFNIKRIKIFLQVRTLGMLPRVKVHPFAVLFLILCAHFHWMALGALLCISTLRLHFDKHIVKSIVHAQQPSRLSGLPIKCRTTQTYQCGITQVSGGCLTCHFPACHRETVTQPKPSVTFSTTCI